MDNSGAALSGSSAALASKRRQQLPAGAGAAGGVMPPHHAKGDPSATGGADAALGLMPAAGASGSGSAPSSAGGQQPSDRRKGFKKSIMGDIFGTTHDPKASMLGMLYRSRIQGGLNMKFNDAQSLEKLEESSLQSLSVHDPDEAAGEGEEEDGGRDSEGEDAEVVDSMSPRLRLAVTIKNWSSKAENDDKILAEGAAHALIALTSIDDPKIRLNCAIAFCNLCSRPNNRQELLNIDITFGIVTIAMNMRKWRVAKLCAMSLCYLTQHPGGEMLMAKGGAVLALVILSNVRNQRLAPICLQALYNLTAVSEYYKGIERVTKALLSMPTLAFDSVPLVLRALVNCSRYPQARTRMIEDGTIQSFAAVVNTVSSRQNKFELLQNVCVCLRHLSENSSCRSDMISKGAIELLNQITPYANDFCRLLLMRTVLNLSHALNSFPSSIFEMTVGLVCEAVNVTGADDVLETAAACISGFMDVKLRQLSHVAINVSRNLNKLLGSSLPLTLFYAVRASYFLLQTHLVRDQELLEAFVRCFIASGAKIEEQPTIVFHSLSLAIMTQDASYLQIFEKFGLLRTTIDLMIKFISKYPNVPSIQISFSMTVCKVLLRIDSIHESLRDELASTLKRLLLSPTTEVIAHAISGMQVLLEHDICHDELLSDEVIDRIGSIALAHSSDVNICRTCAAILAILSFDPSAHGSLSTDALISTIFQLSRSEELMTRLLVTTIICNVSYDVAARAQLIKNGVLDVIAVLSGTTSERIQERCAMCICNLSCATELHSVLIGNKILQIILMIALVRSVANTTKQLSARALLNMCTQENLAAVLDAGVSRALSTLSTVNDPITQNICARGFFWLSSYESGRLDLVQRRATLHSLFGLVKSPAPRTRSAVGKAVFNLFSCKLSRKAMIAASALSVLKILATMDYEDIRECVARVVTGLCQDGQVQQSMVTEPVVPVLVLLIKNSFFSFDYAVHAAACMARYRVFHSDLVQHGMVCALVNAAVSGKIDTRQVALEVCRLFCLLSYTAGLSRPMVTTEYVLIGIHVLRARQLCTKQSSDIIAMLLANLSYCKATRKQLVEHDCFKLLKKLLDEPDGKTRIRAICGAQFIYNLCQENNLHVALVSQDVMGVLSTLASILVSGTVNSISKSQSNLRTLDFALETEFDIDEEGDDPSQWSEKFRVYQDAVHDIAGSIQLMSNTEVARARLVEGGAIRVLESLTKNFLASKTIYEISCAIGNIAKSQSCKQGLVDQGAVELLKSLCASEHKEIQQRCSSALASLSDSTEVGQGTVASLIMMSLNDESSTLAIGGGGGSPTKDEVKDRARQKMESNFASTDSPDNQNRSAMLEKMMMKSQQFSDMPDRSKASHSSSAQFDAYLRKRDHVDNSIGEVVDIPMSSDARALLLSNSYESCEYTIIVAKLSTDAGGISQRVMIELPSPALSNDFAQSNERPGELHALPVVEAPLPKELALVDITDKDEDQGPKKAASSILSAIPSSTTPFFGDKKLPVDENNGSRPQPAPNASTASNRKKPRSQSLLVQKGGNGPPNNK